MTVGTILLSGFGDYEKKGIIIRNNPSQIAVEKFVAQYPTIESYKLIGEVLDAKNREVAGNQVRTLLDRHRPPLFLALGLKTIGTDRLLFESQAMDIRGGDQNIISKMNMSRIVAECNKVGIRARTSSDAGSGICNYIYYIGLELIADKGLVTIMGFIHMPLLSNTVLIGKPRSPEMSLDDMHRAISVTLSHTLRNMITNNN